ncbi:MAG TPA: hypothetical protein VJK03_02000 [Candidatus Nanoarchaeia archaeon]|nr:hypothetical protein [Candidatus Nanoarchaeia archaeon]
MNTIALFFITLFSHTEIFSLLAGLASEDLLLFMALFSGQGLIELWVIAVFGFLGVVVHDSVVFFLMRSELAEWISRKIKLKKKRKSIIKFIQHFSKNGYFIPLLLSKFIYGTRIPLIAYAQHREKNAARFILFNSLAVALWSCVMIPLAWLAGKGFSRAFSVVRGIEGFLGIAVLSILVLSALNRSIRAVFIRRASRVN